MNTFLTPTRAGLCGAFLLLFTGLRGANLPPYESQGQVPGILRACGNPHMGEMLKKWQEGFAKLHPELQFETNLKGTATAQWGLQTWVADIALMSRPIIPYESFGTYRRSYNFPVPIQVATGSLSVPGKSPAVVIFVSKNNPLSKLSFKQLDRIFAAERTGGWQDGMNWVTKGVARGPEENIRTWGQLGVSGALAAQEIIPYGAPSQGAGALTYFQSRISGGSGARNERYREYNDPKELAEALSKDPSGIGYGDIAYLTPDLKVIAIAEKDGGDYVLPTAETVQNRTYPLTRAAYIYFTVDTKTGDLADPLVAPKVHEFIRYVLSQEGQAVVKADGGFLPLTPAIAQEQLAILENPPTARFFRKDRR